MSAVGAGIGRPGKQPSGGVGLPTLAAVEASAGVETKKKIVPGDRTTAWDDVNTEGGDASLTRRLTAGGLAALGAVGAGIGRARNPPGETEESKPSVTELSADAAPNVDEISGGLPAGDVSVEGGDDSYARRLAAGGLAALSAVNTGAGRSGKPLGDGDISMPPAGVPPAGVEGKKEEISGDLSAGDIRAIASGVRLSSDEDPVNRRLAAGGLVALGALGTGAGPLEDKPSGEGGVSLPPAAELSAGVETRKGGDHPADDVTATALDGATQGGNVSFRLAAGGSVSSGAGDTGIRPSELKPSGEMEVSIPSAAAEEGKMELKAVVDGGEGALAGSNAAETSVAFADQRPGKDAVKHEDAITKPVVQVSVT